MLRALSKLMLWLIGWKITGEEYLYLQKKYIITVIPHTSNWDFPLGILVRTAIKAKVRFIAKDALFKPPHGFLFRWMGGMPVDRSKRNNFVQAVVDLYNNHEEFATVIAPEGTRSKVANLKSGFYHIAKGANIPLVLCKFDYGLKVVDFGKPFYTTDDQEADFEYLREYFKNVIAKNPELAWPNPADSSRLKTPQ